MARKSFNLMHERLRVESMWRGRGDAHVALGVAAAMAFHRVHGNARSVVTRQDYDDALSLAAAGLARLVPVYVMNDPREGRQPLTIDFATQAFAKGATRLRSADGTSVGELTVLRSDLISALAQLRASGLPLFVPLPPPSPKQNRLLARLPEGEYARLEPHLELVALRSHDVLYAERAELRHVHFPVSGVVSLLYVTEGGETTEIAVIGNEGAVGMALLLGATSTPRRAVVQIAGYAYAIPAEVVRAEFHRGGVLQSVMLLYVQTLMNQMSQTAVCNRHHTIEQQLCRWLLLSLDRVASNEVLMTQELISQMLGVRRSGITEAAKSLQQAGVIRYTRGRITVPDRGRLESRACECYAVVKKEGERLAMSP